MPYLNKEGSSAEVSFELVGGLGNQLFIYFASRYYMSKTGIRTSLDLSTIGTGGTNHGRSILDFDLKGNFIESNGKNPFSIPRRISARIIARIPRLRGILLQNSRNYVSDVLGFDQKLLSIQGGTNVHGYFQSWKYFENFQKTEEAHIKLVRYSKWYQDTLELMKLTDPTVIHIRIGDYLPLRESFGILGGSYYRRAVDHLKTHDTFPIWVFSDDIEMARKILLDSGISNTVYISPPEGTPASESMMMMSNAKRIVIGNSTFSWWAAMFGSEDKKVVYPKPWFRNSEEPQELIPPSWTEIKSSWW
jgi:hypothetical protein